MSRPKTKPMVYDLEKNNHFKTTVSTNTCINLPKVVFLRSKVKITPLIKDKDYEESILLIKEKFYIFMNKLLKKYENYNDRSIISIDISEKSVQYNKVSHLRYDLFFKPIVLDSLQKHSEILKIFSKEIDDFLSNLFLLYDLKTLK